ncbi:fatty acid-binding protein homolog 5 isoform X1 [Patella vulgata]|uniref:fatty acid-binding protein homolog 5 isoform X1 n=1 Tax=Patella vulgata TaxID=6465 RepID=UPI0024A7B17A|nr:fatty acid-binding protein homolog 5 isoform X1 [Patella vulgata]
MSKLLGHWKLDKSENFDEYMKSMGVSYVLRKVGNSITSYEEIRQNGDEWEILVTSTFKNQTLKFKLGEEFDENTIDGRHVKSTFTLEDGALVQIQKAIKEGECDSHMSRTLADDDTLILTFRNIQKDVTTVRTFKRYTP